MLMVGEAQILLEETGCEILIQLLGGKTTFLLFDYFSECKLTTTKCCIIVYHTHAYYQAGTTKCSRLVLIQLDPPECP